MNSERTASEHIQECKKDKNEKKLYKKLLNFLHLGYPHGGQSKPKVVID